MNLLYQKIKHGLKLKEEIETVLPFYTGPETEFNEDKGEYMGVWRNQERESDQNQ